MKKTLMSLMVVLVVFSFVSFAAAQEKDPMEGVTTYQGNFQWVPGGLPWQLFIPHYDISSGWWSGLVLHNMSVNANQMTISFCDNDGWVEATKEVALTGFQKQAWMLTYAMTGCQTGWIVVESQLPLLGFINFGQNFSNGTGSVTTLGPFNSN